MLYARITAEVKDEGATIKVEGKPIEIMNLAIQVMGSTIADMPKLIQPYIINRVQESIPLAVENDAKAARRDSEDEEWQMPETEKEDAEESGDEKPNAFCFNHGTPGFMMAKDLARVDPRFKQFIREILNDLDKEEG